MQGLGGLTSKKEKFLSFGANGVAIFQRIRVGVIVQLQREVVPFVVAIQCCSLKTKLAMLMVSRIVIVQRMGYLLATLYTYFSKLPKKVSWIFKTRWNDGDKWPEDTQILKERLDWNVGPLKLVLFEYPLFFVKMAMDYANYAPSRDLFHLLCDVETLLPMAAIVPLFEAI